MKIINIMLGKGLGGIQQSFIDYQTALSLHHCSLAVCHPHALIRRQLVDSGISYKTVFNFGAWDLLAMLRIRLLLRRHNADLIIAHGNRAIQLAHYARLKTGIPLVAVTHNYSQKLLRADAVFATTNDLSRDAVARGTDPDKIFIVPNMIQLDAIPQAPRRHSRPCLTIGTLGRFVKIKGIVVLIKALHLLNLQGISFRAVIAGSGPEADHIQSLTQQLGIADKVSFPGWVDDKDTFFNDLDIFCLPSLHESFGITLLEAFAYQTPLVATRTKGPSEIVTHNDNGLLCDVNDSHSLAYQLKRLIQDRALALRLAEQGLATVKSNYALPMVAKTIDRHLTAIVQPYARSRSLSDTH